MAIIDSNSVKFKIGILPENKIDRLAYLYRLQEKLRLYHNVYGQEYRDGKITLEELRHFQNSWFEPRNGLICTLINNCKNEIGKDDAIVCDIDDIEEK